MDRALRCSHEVAVMMTDPLGRLVWANPASERLTGWRSEEMQGLTPGSLLQCESTDRAEVARLSRHVRAGSAVVTDLLNRHKSGRLFWVRLQLLPSHAQDGTLLGFLALQTDVTDEVTRRQAHNAARDQVLSTFSHEVRTPLNAVLNFLDLLQTSHSPEQQQVWLQQCLRAARALKDLTGTVLETGRAAYFDQQLPPSAVRLQDLMSQLMVVSSGYPRSLDVDLQFYCQIGAPMVFVRPDLLLRVLLNLVSNALKYTRTGAVVVRVEVAERGAADGEVMLRFSVTDTGIGIAAEDRARILRPFETVADAQSPGQDSTGLGLPLCEQMLRAMGSALRLHSTPGLGSCFSFELQCALATLQSQKPHEPADNRSLMGLRAMVVDDDPVNLMVAQAQLERLGASVYTASGPARALVDMAALGPGAVDVVLMDMQMPVMDGPEAARRLLALPGFGDQAIVALSGEVSPKSVDRALASGMRGFLEKPFDAVTLAEQLGVYRRSTVQA